MNVLDSIVAVELAAYSLSLLSFVPVAIIHYAAGREIGWHRAACMVGWGAVAVVLVAIAVVAV